MLCSTLTTAQTGIGIAPAKVNFGTLGRGGNITPQDLKIYNTGNDSAINYTITVNPAISDTIHVSPSMGAITPKSNATVMISGTVGNDAKDGVHNGLILVNTTAKSNSSVGILPALAVKVTYTVNGNAPSPTTTSASNAGIDAAWPALGIIAIFAVVAVAYLLRRR